MDVHDNTQIYKKTGTLNINIKHIKTLHVWCWYTLQMKMN